MKNTFLKAAAVVALSVATAGAASAQSGLLNVVGQAQLSSASATAPLFIDFLTGAAFPPTVTGLGNPGTVFAGSSTGIFAGTSGMVGVMNDLVINATGTTINTVPAGLPALTIGAYTFTLGPVLPGAGGNINFGPIVLEDRAGGAVADLNLQGLVSGGACGVNNCTYRGIVTAQFAGMTSAMVFNSISTGQASPVVTFSGNFTANVIPEPSTYALLATGIGALGFVARRRRQQA